VHHKLRPKGEFGRHGPPHVWRRAPIRRSDGAAPQNDYR